MIKFTVLQEVINKRYNVYTFNSAFYGLKKEGIVTKESTKISKYLPYLSYDIDSEIEIIDREVIDRFERNDMIYKIGDKLWCNNEVYHIKDIIYTYDEIKLYIDKQRLDREIGKNKAEELLKEIKLKQMELKQKEHKKDNASYRKPKKEKVYFEEILISKEKCRVEHELIDKAITHLHTDMAYLICVCQTFKDGYFLNFGDLICMLSHILNANDLKEVIKNGNWYLDN